MFDNATGVGRRTGTKVVESRLFGAFKLHYRTQARYCNPYSGHEKGNVENAVGFLRRNLMVPEPEAATLAGLNQLLLARCDDLAAGKHWRKAVPVGDLFTRDVAASLALPGVGFDPVRYEQRRTDKTGNLFVESNTYAAGPSFGSRQVTVGLRHDTVQILDEAAEPVVVFERVFGRSTVTAINPARIVPLLAAKPGSWSHSPLRPLVSDPLRDWLDTADASHRRRVFTAVAATSVSAGFEAAVAAADTLIRAGDDPAGAGLGMLARRIAQGEPAPVAGVDLGVYDTLVATTGASA